MGWADIGQLTCGHCAVKFDGSKSQIRKVKYESATVYCSLICRGAATGDRCRRPTLQQGPCPTCNNTFESKKREKIFCSLECYIGSPLHKKNSEQGLRAADENRSERERLYREENTLTCLECEKKFYALPSKKSKFCKHSCYRSYMAKRFDRWVASPERIALPNNFDEFLMQNELPCLVDGCGWSGHALSQHMNYSHGVPAAEFKRAVGFNLGTGVVSPALSATLRERENIGAGLVPIRCDEVRRKRTSGYVSLESKEHGRKARAMSPLGPERQCAICSEPFKQSTPFGKALYCSKECQSKEMASREWGDNYSLTCSHCETTFLGNRGQHRRSSRGQPIMCSIQCRNTARWSRQRVLANDTLHGASTANEVVS